MAAHARPCNGECREAFEHQQRCKRNDGEPERAVERIAEDRHTERDAKQTYRQQFAPTRAQIVDTEQYHHEADHGRILPALCETLLTENNLPLE
ncbi:hypothetical protein ACFQ3P_24255 [Paraburkholderia sabiae]|uniref:Uncharacterized protein n=1 Tax=Paraburkholderia sabiae TaxID=273251 RepID=A0ABU9QJH6_9BURK|nr:hypothetical protein [Paraburkholderia sabiae]WJZ76369.1 hypothetical protein QEN71_11370 [Paraburkholderia sabiae]